MAPMRALIELPAGRRRRRGLHTARPGREGVWWRPDRIGWWMGVLFAIGSTCFGVAATASQWASVTRPGIGITFFVGSIFFTSAAFLQLHEAINAQPGPEHLTRAAFRRWWSWEPRRIDWLAAAVQFVGTLFFNVNTFAAMNDALDAKQELLRVWTPDVIGSICFLVASELAYAEVCNAWVCFRNRTISWWIVAVNMLGSIAFGVSAVASLIQPSTGEPVSAAIANATTAWGGWCFLVGALLLIVETGREAPEPSPVVDQPSEVPA